MSLEYKINDIQNSLKYFLELADNEVEEADNNGYDSSYANNLSFHRAGVICGLKIALDYLK